jgi:flavorubredoxin
VTDRFKAVQITDDVYWVGAIDWSIHDFHGYRTGRGTSYNAFLITADRPTLVDTVKAPFREELLGRISSVMDPSKIEIVVSNHAEMDHSGCLREIIETVKPASVYASRMGVRALEEHFRLGSALTAVTDGEKLSLGNMHLSFFETRMLHWPDSMICYLPERETLFSQDGFGMHLASGERFADEIPDEILVGEGAKYFANILLLYAPLVLKLLDRVGELGVPIRILAPDHGPVWRQDIDRILGLYRTWVEQKPTRKAVVVYDTMWQSTEKLARAVAEGLVAGGVRTRVLSLGSHHRSDVATEILDAGALLVGSPTLNNGLYPTVADLLSYLRGLKPRNLLAAAFGSYGWSGEAVRRITDELRAMKTDLVHEGLRVKYVPDPEALGQCVALGREVAERLGKICGGGS